MPNHGFGVVSGVCKTSLPGPVAAFVFASNREVNAIPMKSYFSKRDSRQLRLPRADEVTRRRWSGSPW